MADIDLNMFDDGDTIETDATPEAKSIKIRSKIKAKKITKAQELSDIITHIPTPGYSYHYISSGKYDFYTAVPLFVDLLGVIDEFYGSTWTMSRDHAVDLLNQFDSGKIKKISMLTGLYFKRRETAVYSTLVEGLIKRGQRYTAAKNHAKVILINSGNHRIVIEGSANFTANPRIEQYVMTNNKRLYEFHREWMEVVLNGRA